MHKTLKNTLIFFKISWLVLFILVKFIVSVPLPIYYVIELITKVLIGLAALIVFFPWYSTPIHLGKTDKILGFVVGIIMLSSINYKSEINNIITAYHNKYDK